MLDWFMEDKADGAEAKQSILPNGICYALFAYDAARSVDLDGAERCTHEATQRQTIRHKRRAPRYFEYQPPPLRLSQETAKIRFRRLLYQ